MFIITSNTFKNSWFFRLALGEGIQAIIRKNQAGRSFFTLYGNTFPVKDKLKELGFRYFQQTWSMPFDFVTDSIKSELQNLGIDISLLNKPEDIAPKVPEINVPQEVSKIQPSEKSEIQPTQESGSGEAVKEEKEEKEEKFKENTQESNQKSSQESSQENNPGGLKSTELNVPEKVDKELEYMRQGVDLAMKQSPNEKVRGLTAFIDRMIEKIANLTDEAAKSEFIKNFMQFAAKFHNYSFHNQILIWAQNPHASYIRGFRQWLELGREVTNWDKGIVIIAPMTKKVKNEKKEMEGNNKEKTITFFGAVKVYDVKDTQVIDGWEKTTGKKAFSPQSWRKDPNEDMDEINLMINSIYDWAKTIGIEIKAEKMAEDMGGFSAGGKIALNDTYKGINLFSTLVHECAHEILHWEKNKSPEGTKVRSKESLELTRQQKEIDAETTAYIVLQHYGFETMDAPNYLALWEAKGEDVKRRREAISRSVKTIIEGINKVLSNKPLNTEEIENQEVVSPVMASGSNIFKIKSLRIISG
jgi:hypothetical protein